jgi:hypothetical protein
MGFCPIALVKMDAPQKPLDLELWLDADLIQRQNRLKSQFLAVLEEVNEQLIKDELRGISLRAKGTKISKGNDLIGFPYQVLDIIRDFDPEAGANIRLLNWIGVGFFCSVLLGETRRNPNSGLLALGYGYALSESKWDYPDVVLNRNFTAEMGEIESSTLKFHHWIKRLTLTSDSAEVVGLVTAEVKKILDVLQLTK